MLLIKTYPDNSFIRIPRELSTNPNITDKALRLYLFLMGLNSRMDISREFLINSLHYPGSVIDRARKNLVDNNLLYVHRKGVRHYIGYLSIPGLPAKLEFNKYTKINTIGE